MICVCCECVGTSVYVRVCVRVCEYDLLAYACTAALTNVDTMVAGESEWEVYHDAHGTPYYHNRRTHETSWTRPQ